MLLWNWRLAILGLFVCHASSSRLVVHDEAFVPTTSLFVTHQNTSTACRSKPLVLINETSPGPVLRLRENVTSWIRVYNRMDDYNLTIHWHGLSQSVAPFSDGTPQASQWPIAPHHFFDYEIRPSIGEAGTYFYHSHIGFQASSAAGPLIIEESGDQPPYDYDEEKILMLTEYYNHTDSVIEEGLTASPLRWSGETEVILVNGNGYPALGGEQVDVTPPFSPSGSNTDCRPEIIDVEPGKTYRFRTIGGTAIGLVMYRFEKHPNLSVVAADGQYTKPVATDRIQVGPGQRFDYLLHTKTEQELRQLNQTLFWVQLELRYRPVNVTSYALLRYNLDQMPEHRKASIIDRTIPSSPPAQRPLHFTDDIQSWLEYQLTPLVPNGFPNASAVTRTVFLISAQLNPNNTNPVTLGASNYTYWSANHHTWTESNEHLHNTSYSTTGIHTGVPYLVSIYQHGEAAIPDYDLAVSRYGGWDPALNVYAARQGEIIDIVLLNAPAGIAGGFDNHPWHIHGGHVYDLGAGAGTYNASANEARLAGFTPALRDTTFLYKYQDNDGLGGSSGGPALTPYDIYGWRAWRLRVDDTGVWMVHCHILQHMVMGMQTVWVMGNASEIRAKHEPYVNGYLNFGGSAYGNASVHPWVYHYFDEDR